MIKFQALVAATGNATAAVPTPYAILDLLRYRFAEDVRASISGRGLLLELRNVSEAADWDHLKIK